MHRGACRTRRWGAARYVRQDRSLAVVLVNAPARTHSTQVDRLSGSGEEFRDHLCPWASAAGFLNPENKVHLPAKKRKHHNAAKVHNSANLAFLPSGTVYLQDVKKFACAAKLHALQGRALPVAMPTALSKPDLRIIYNALGRALPLGAPAKDPQEIVDISRVRALVEKMFDEVRSATERGVKVLEWRLPRARAPRLNEYAYLKVWMKDRLRKELDDEARELMKRWPAADLYGAQKTRWVRVTRFSRNKIDELSVDVVGGKMPIDSLVRVGILHDDNQRFLIREARQLTTSHGNTHVLIEVFEVADEEVPCDEPKDAKVEQVVRTRGKLTKHIVEARAPRSKGKR